MMSIETDERYQRLGDQRHSAPPPCALSLYTPTTSCNSRSSLSTTASRSISLTPPNQASLFSCHLDWQSQPPLPPVTQVRSSSSLICRRHHWERTHNLVSMCILPVFASC